MVEHVLRGLRGDDAGAWLDQGTEHPHRLAISVRQDRVPAARQQLSEAFAARGLQVRAWGIGCKQQRALPCRMWPGVDTSRLEALGSGL